MLQSTTTMLSSDPDDATADSGIGTGLPVNAQGPQEADMVQATGTRGVTAVAS